MATKTVLVTGCNRGIGLQFVQEYIKLGWNVIAAVRDPATADELSALAPYKIVQLDIGDEESVLNAAKELDGEAIDLLINNAGIIMLENLANSSKANMLKLFEVNAIGPFLVTRAFIPHLKVAVTKNGSANVAQISSLVGSIDLNIGKNYGYPTSKAALNMISSSLAIDLKRDNIGVFILHPGYVNTRMTGGRDIVWHGNVMKAISTQSSAQDLIEVISKRTLEDTGKFYSYTGESIPW
ncbi:Short chain dehydrogenase, partial [Globisporangium splendens]